MRLGIIAAALLSSVVGAAYAAGQPSIHQVELKTGDMGYLLTCNGVEECATLGPRLCPGKTAMWSDSKGKFGNVPVSMRQNGNDTLMVVRCE